MSEVITLDTNSPPVQYLCKKDKRLAKVISMIGSITYSPHDEEPFAFLVHEIIEQMLSVKAGAKIYGRLLELCDGSITPTAISSLSDSELRTIGTSQNKVSYIRALTNAVTANSLCFDSLSNMSDKDVIKELTRIKGIGKWTANMYLIFVLNRDDILPVEDVAFLQSYKWLYKTEDIAPESIKKKCKKWKPYSSIASRFLYHALDDGFTKNEFHLYK